MNIRLEYSLWQRLHDYSEKTGASQNFLIQKAVRTHLDKLEKISHVFTDIYMGSDD